MCGDEWTEGQQGWVLCDSDGCENCVCPKCTSTLSLSVSELLFYCPICAGSGDSAAATAGGAVATAVAACTELEKLPLSFKTTKRILSNLSKNPNDLKYRKLRLENKSVKQLVDLEPVLNILTSIGFVRTQCARQIHPTQGAKTNANLPPTEEVLLLEGPVLKEVNELLEILDGLSSEHNENNVNSSDNTNSSSTELEEKRKSSTASEETKSNKKQKGEGKESSI